jgi:Flp pilus assembly pilin Flp
MMTLRSEGLKWLAGRFIRSRSGAVSVEYVLIAGLVAIMLIQAISSVRDALQDLGWNKIATAISHNASDED